MMTRNSAMTLVCLLASACSGNMPTASATGAWAGTMPLCVDTVIATKSGFDRQGGGPKVKIVLTSAGSEQLAAVTGQLVGKPMEVRVNGVVVAAPIIVEPFHSDSFDVVGLQPGQSADLQSLARAQCPRS